MLVCVLLVPKGIVSNLIDYEYLSMYQYICDVSCVLLVSKGIVSNLIGYDYLSIYVYIYI